MNVWLIGGASGVGKSLVAYALARELAVPIVEIDDIVEAILVMTTPDQQPVLHHWQTHPEAAHLPPEGMLELQVAVADALGPAIEAVVANHLETGMPVVIEGDYLLPSVAAQTTVGGQAAYGRVRAVFLSEPSEDQILRNYGEREPSEPAQAGRARVSHLYDRWLVAEAMRLGVAVVEARPWATVVGRVREVLEG